MSRPTAATYKTGTGRPITWEAVQTGKRGRQRDYGDAAIQTCLTMQVLFGMALRQPSAIVESLLRIIGLGRAAPCIC